MQTSLRDYPPQSNAAPRASIGSDPHAAEPLSRGHRLLGRLRNTLYRLGRSARGSYAYVCDWVVYNRQISRSSPFRAHLSDASPCLADRYQDAGSVRGHYFQQDLWAAKLIHRANPPEHWDIGSRIDGFIAHLLVFREVHVIDIRGLSSEVEGLLFHRGDLTALDIPTASISSLSCLHAMEHVGLGRYGDPIDPEGCFQGMRELARVLAPKGKLYFSVPIGRERVEFNAHRIFSPDTIVQHLSSLKLLHFAAIDDEDRLRDPADWKDFRTANLACGLFVFTK
jgi:SAM-dependent methyltransferase